MDTDRASTGSEEPKVSRRVLIVEDEPIIAFDLMSAIEADNHDVVGQCDSAVSAVEMARDLKPDVIVMDIGLIGDGDGLEAAEEIQNTLGIGCIFISATLDKIDPSKWKDLKPVALIPKPYRDDLLSKAIRDYKTDR